MQAFMRPKVEEKTYFVISNPFKEDWQPEWKRVDGEVFVKIDKFECDFFRYCTGQAIKWGKRHDSQNHYFPFWDDLINLRNQLSQTAFEKKLEDMREDAGQGKRVRARKARMSDAGLAGEVVEGIMKFGHLEQTAKMLFGCRGAHVWVSIDPDVLAFIQHAMHSNFVAEHMRPEPTKSKKRKTGDHADDGKDDDGEDGGKDDGNDQASKPSASSASSASASK